MALKSSKSEVYNNPIKEKNEIEHFYFQNVLEFFSGDTFLYNDNFAKEITYRHKTVTFYFYFFPNKGKMICKFRDLI